MSILAFSASESAYIFLKYITDNNIDKDMATMLYTGIMTDTGCFNYNNTSARTMRVVAELLDIGADNFLVNKKINDTIQESKLRLVAKTIDNIDINKNEITTCIAYCMNVITFPTCITPLSTPLAPSHIIIILIRFK